MGAEDIAIPPIQRPGRDAAIFERAGGERYNIRVRLAPQDRDSIDHIRALRVNNGAGIVPGFVLRALPFVRPQAMPPMRCSLQSEFATNRNRDMP